jgi:SSS family solute:Na+ symporter
MNTWLLQTTQYLLSYFIVVSTYGYTIYRKREKKEHDAKTFSRGEPNMVGYWAS